jgi:hypothetical protein
LFSLDNSVLSQCIVAGSAGLIARLGIKGLIEDIEFPTALAMTEGGENSHAINLTTKPGIHYSAPTAPSSSNPLASSSSPNLPAASSSVNPPVAPSNPPVASSNPPVASSSNPPVASSNSLLTPSTPSVSSYSRYGWKGISNVLNGEVGRLSSEISKVTSEIAKTSDPSTKATLEDKLAYLLEDLSFFSKEAAAETRKGFAAEESKSLKRDLDSSKDESSSKKRN